VRRSKSDTAMTALGSKRRFDRRLVTSGLSQTCQLLTHAQQQKRLYLITSSARASSIGFMVSLVEPAKERLEEIRYDAAVARLDFRDHGHRELENMRVAPPP
jgi:hypothetical protein